MSEVLKWRHNEIHIVHTHCAGRGINNSARHNRRRVVGQWVTSIRPHIVCIYLFFGGWFIHSFVWFEHAYAVCAALQGTIRKAHTNIHIVLYYMEMYAKTHTHRHSTPFRARRPSGAAKLYTTSLVQPASANICGCVSRVQHIIYSDTKRSGVSNGSRVHTSRRIGSPWGKLYLERQMAVVVPYAVSDGQTIYVERPQSSFTRRLSQPYHPKHNIIWYTWHKQLVLCLHLHTFMIWQH